jgi:hypothetical protein
VTLEAPHERLEQMLAGDDSVANVTVEGRVAAFDFSGDERRQANLLRTLVSAGLAVAAFEEARENLHDSYLRTVRRQAP